MKKNYVKVDGVNYAKEPTDKTERGYKDSPPPSLPNRSEKESEKAICVICGNPMPKGEEMFKFHGYSGDCPPKKEGWKAPPTEKEIEREQIRHQYAEELKDGVNKLETHWDEGCDIETVSKSDVLSLLERKGEK